MEKKDFLEDHRYTVTLKDENGKARPANFYVLKRHNEFMIVRMTDKDGALRKIHYAQIEKIVKVIEVTKQNRFTVPEMLLSDKHWKDRTSIAHYSSMPHAGK